MVRVAIQRLTDVAVIKSQYIPFVTGPGAVKSAMVSVVKLPYALIPIINGKAKTHHRTYTPHRIIHNGI